MMASSQKREIKNRARLCLSFKGQRGTQRKPTQLVPHVETNKGVKPGGSSSTRQSPHTREKERERRA